MHNKKYPLKVCWHKCLIRQVIFAAFQGNVALDVARILLRKREDLATTDISNHALLSLQESTIRWVVIIQSLVGSESFATSFANISYGGLSPINHTGKYFWLGDVDQCKQLVQQKNCEKFWVATCYWLCLCIHEHIYHLIICFMISSRVMDWSDSFCSSYCRSWGC